MKYTNFGIRVARLSSHNFKHSSLVLRGGKIVSYGYNHHDVHAEVNALKDLWPNKRVNCILINFRIGKKGELRNSSPCEDCLEYSRKAGVRKILYSTESGFKEIKL